MTRGAGSGTCWWQVRKWTWASTTALSIISSGFDKPLPLPSQDPISSILSTWLHLSPDLNSPSSQIWVIVTTLDWPFLNTSTKIAPTLSALLHYLVHYSALAVNSTWHTVFCLLQHSNSWAQSIFVQLIHHHYQRLKLLLAYSREEEENVGILCHHIETKCIPATTEFSP